MVRLAPLAGRADEIDVEFFGQASMAVRVGDCEVLSDPWLLRPAQLGAWEPYPKLTASEVSALQERLDRATHVYLSHDHADHFDPQLIARLAPKQLVVAPFHNRSFRTALEALARDCGHRVVELAPGETLPLCAQATLRIIAEQPRFRTNSMMLLDTPLGAILNANDCGLNSAALAGIARRHRVRLFFSTLNFMANGYPFPYLRSDDPSLRAQMDRVRDQVVESFRLAMQVLKPDLALPFAGPVRYPDRCYAHLNEHPEAVDWRRMVEELSRGGAIRWLTPGARIRVTQAAIDVEEGTSWPRLLCERPPAPATRIGPHEELDRAQLERAAAVFLERVGSAVSLSGQTIGLPLYLSAVASREGLEQSARLGTLRIDLDPPRQFRWLDQVEPPCLHMTSTPSVLSGYLRGTITYDELLLSAYARFERRPDVFHGTLHNFLRFGHDPDAIEELLRWLVQRSQGRATFVREIAGKRYTLPRFCPHEGESLEHATIEDGKLTCPRHKWCFELDSGNCVAVGDPSVNLYQDAGGR